MAKFDRSCTNSYQSVIINIALFCIIFELFGVEEYHDFEILARASQGQGNCDGAIRYAAYEFLFVLAITFFNS